MGPACEIILGCAADTVGTHLFMEASPEGDTATIVAGADRRLICEEVVLRRKNTSATAASGEEPPQPMAEDTGALSVGNASEVDESEEGEAPGGGDGQSSEDYARSGMDTD
jgi:hypothetical protein